MRACVTLSSRSPFKLKGLSSPLAPLRTALLPAANPTGTPTNNAVNVHNIIYSLHAVCFCARKQNTVGFFVSVCYSFFAVASPARRVLFRTPGTGAQIGWSKKTPKKNGVFERKGSSTRANTSVLIASRPLVRIGSCDSRVVCSPLTL